MTTAIKKSQHNEMKSPRSPSLLSINLSRKADCVVMSVSAASLMFNSYMEKGSKGKTPNSSLKSTSIVAVIATYCAAYSSPPKSIVHMT